MLKPIKEKLSIEIDVDWADSEPIVDLEIGDRHLWHFLEDKKPTSYYLDSGTYRITLKIEKVKK